MTAQLPFHDLMHRVRAGDEDAAAQLVHCYEPEIRRYIRVRLTNPHLHRVLDSLDICQSVLANFFVRVAAGQFDLEEPGQLIRLLVTMANNKLVDYARKPSYRKTLGADSELMDNRAGNDASPSRIVAHQDLLQEVRRRLTDAERRLMELRADGRSWEEIATDCGGAPDASRKKLSRAIDRVCQELDIDRVGYA